MNRLLKIKEYYRHTKLFVLSSLESQRHLWSMHRPVCPAEVESTFSLPGLALCPALNTKWVQVAQGQSQT